MTYVMFSIKLVRGLFEIFTLSNEVVFIPLHLVYKGGRVYSSMGSCLCLPCLIINLLSLILSLAEVVISFSVYT